MNQQFFLKKGDTSPAIRYQVNLPSGSTLNGATAKFKLRDYFTNELLFERDADVDGAAGTLQYDWLQNDTNTPAIYRSEFVVTFADSKIETLPNNGFIEIHIGDDV